MNTLGELAKGRDSNFNLIRMLAATAVLVSHSYPLALGPTGLDPVSEWIGISLGELAVIVFFCVSGFFISMSRDRSGGNLDFYLARSLRIFPGLLGVLLITALVIGTTFSILPVSDYLSRSGTYQYISGGMSLYAVRFNLPGVFEDDPCLTGINGSLWTLAYEALMYVLVGVLGTFAVFDPRRSRFLWFLAIYFTVYVSIKTATAYIPALATLSRIQALVWTSLPFVIGMTLYRYRTLLTLPPIWILPLGVLAAWSLKLFLFESLTVFLVYATFYFGFATNRWLSRYNQLGDYSYGVYIYAFPIQQVVAHLFKGISPSGLMAIALPLTLTCALLSWHFIEQPSMAWRRQLASKMRSVLHSLRKPNRSAGPL